jgi:hypothetical protein
LPSIAGDFMAFERLDIADCFVWEDDLPRPQWQLLQTWVETRVEPDDQRDAWTDILRQWQQRLGETLGKSYQCTESENFLVLAPAIAAEPFRAARKSGLRLERPRRQIPGGRAIGWWVCSAIASSNQVRLSSRQCCQGSVISTNYSW